MVEYWARLSDKLEDGEITESEYWLKKIKSPRNPAHEDTSYSLLLNLDDEDQMVVENIDDSEEVADALKDLFPDFSYVKRKRKPKKE